MKIPKEIYLHGQTIKIVYRKDILHEDDSVGLAVYRKNEIQLLDIKAEGLGRKQTKQEEWFCHELVHFILDQMEEKDLCGNEKFVGLFGNLLHQALSSAKY